MPPTPATAPLAAPLPTIQVDLRSDTLTRPTPPMREAMARPRSATTSSARIPTVERPRGRGRARHRQRGRALHLVGDDGQPAGDRVHTRPRDEVIVGEGAHPIWYECGAGAALSGVQFAIAGTRGLFTADEMEATIKPSTYWSPKSSLVCIENTHNRAGGRVFPQADVKAIGERARARGLAVHLDGARLWNASVATGLSIDALAAPADTVTVCFSKGLGAPVGSALCGTRAMIEKARRFRKMWGGGTRQAGILAAGALYALRNHRARLAEDHANAKRLAGILAATKGARSSSRTWRRTSSRPSRRTDSPKPSRGTPGRSGSRST